MVQHGLATQVSSRIKCRHSDDGAVIKRVKKRDDTSQSDVAVQSPPSYISKETDSQVSTNGKSVKHTR